MTNWNTDEHGNRTFTHNGWTVRIWEKSYTYRINIDSPHRGEEVEVQEEGIWVNGESSGFGWEGPTPSPFTIPWAVITAIVEARGIVEKEKE